MLNNAAWEAYKAGLFRQAAGIFRQARRVAEGNGDERRRVYSLFWEGDSLCEAGDLDAGLALLLQVATTSSPEVDPADVVYGMTKALRFASSRRPAAFLRRLLGDLSGHLERLGKEAWAHRLHLLEGNLLFAQGNFVAALQAQENAWALYRNTYPRFTRATHLWSLCRCCFALKDAEGLTRWLGEIEANQAESEVDWIRTPSSRLLLLRIPEHRADGGVAAQEIARSVLRRLDAMEFADLRTHWIALRALSLFGSHDEAEARLGAIQPREDDDRFDHRLLSGDLALCRSRAHLALEPQDDEWDVEFPLPVPPFADREGALRQLASAREHFESALPITAREDERLETTHYSRTLAGRLERVEALRQAIEAAQ